MYNLSLIPPYKGFLTDQTVILSVAKWATILMSLPLFPLRLNDLITLVKLPKNLRHLLLFHHMPPSFRTEKMSAIHIHMWFPRHPMASHGSCNAYTWLALISFQPFLGCLPVLKSGSWKQHFPESPAARVPQLMQGVSTRCTCTGFEGRSDGEAVGISFKWLP